MSNKYSIVETVKQCSYSSKLQDYFANVLIELTSTSPSAKVIRMTYKNENVAAVKYNVPTQFKERSYEIPIVIYMTHGMPYSPPEVYLERNAETGVNPKNGEIDQKTNKILTKSLANWNSSIVISTVLKEIISSFNKNFPIYKITNSSNGNGVNSHSFNNNVNTGNTGNTVSTGINKFNSYSKPLTDSVYQNLFLSSTGNSSENTTNNNTNSNTNSNYINLIGINPNPTVNSNNNSQSSNSNSSIGMNINISTSSYSNVYNNISPSNFMPASYSSLCEKLSKPPAKNTIYHNLYGGNNSNISNNSNGNLIDTSIYSNVFSNGNSNSNSNNSSYNNNLLFTDNLRASIPDLSIDDKQVEEQIKKILIEEIKSASLESKIKEELKRNKQTEDKLKNYKHQFNAQIEKYNKYFVKKDGMMAAFTDFMTKSDKEIKEIERNLAEMQDNMINQSNLETYIQSSNSTFIKILAVEATFEDLMGIIRKGFEKNAINFNETTKMIRAMTREAFKVKTYRDKLIKQQE